MSTQSLIKEKEKKIEVRFSWPEEVHAKIRSRQRFLSASQDRDVSFEEACIDFIKNAKL